MCYTTNPTICKSLIVEYRRYCMLLPVCIFLGMCDMCNRQDAVYIPVGIVYIKVFVAVHRVVPLDIRHVRLYCKEYIRM